MAQDQEVPGLSRGYRIPDFALPTGDGRTLLLYELVAGRPLLLAACASGWSATEADRFIDAVHTAAKRAGILSVVISKANAAQRAQRAKAGGPALPDRAPLITLRAGGAAPSDGSATGIDADGALRRRLFGPASDGEDGMVVIADPNLRVMHGAAVERAALTSDALLVGLDALAQEGLRELAQEAQAGPAAAPVLIVPRVLPPEVCRGLVESFPSWAPAPSPMPTPDGAGLAVDPARKSRMDAIIADATLEKELTASVARRVLPEVKKAFQYPATRFERLKLVCYQATDDGHFAAHRDNTAPSTAHRRFALTVNLNQGEYDGGALAFPEYGGAAYDVAAGSALVFSGTHAHLVQAVTRGERYALISFIFGEEALPARRPPA